MRRAAASAGALTLIGSPRSAIVPELMASAPTRALATSVRPAPMSPAKPRISPWYSSKVTSLSRLFVDSPFTDRRTFRSSRRCSGRALLVISRPTISEMISRMVVVAVSRVST